MQFVDEQDGSFARSFQATAGGTEERPQVLDSGCRGIQLRKLRLRVRGDELCERSFAGSRWAVEDDGTYAICLEHPSQEFSRSEKMLLAGEFLKRLRAHSCSERFGGIAMRSLLVVKESLQRKNLHQMPVGMICLNPKSKVGTYHRVV